ncbi:MAG: hypothetical protein WCO57_12855 [Verrucomicrobiota bacterium]
MGQSRTLRSFRLALAAPAVVLTLATAQAGTPAAPAAAPESAAANWIGFTIGGAFVSGNDAGMHTRTQTNGDFYGGIDSMQYTQALDKSTTLTIDGHALPGLEDYEANVNVTNSDIGYIKAGFKQFRTWYDASGGYLQGANMIVSGVGSQFDDDQSIDRGEIYFEAGLRKEGMPEVTFSYKHLYRDGQKDSTCWGDTQNNNNWGGIASSNVAFKLMPALWNIDEKSDIFELDVEHTLGNTDLGIGLTYENYSLDNSRYTPRWGATPSAAVGITKITLTEKTDADVFAGNIHSVTRFNDNAWLSFAASYSSTDTDIGGGSRALTQYWPTPIPASPTRRDYAYNQMSGSSDVDQFICNLNFMWVPVQDLTVTPSLRYEHESIDTYSNFNAFNTNQTWQGLESLGSFSDMDSTTGALDLRYTGISNVVLYAKGQWGQENEDILRQDLYLPGEFLSTDVRIDEQEYVVGANWYALSNLSFSAQGFYKQRDASMDHLEGNQLPVSNAGPGGANNFRPIMTEHDTAMTDFNVRVTWRPMGNVSLVTRYDYAHTDFHNAGINWSAPAPAIFYPIIESGNVTSHILSESITWNPMERLYVQGNVSWVSSETKTPEVYTGKSDNDFLTASLTAGYAIDDRTDITASYTYYGASNYDNSKGYTGVNTMGFGQNTQENAISLTLTRALTPNMIWNLRYGWITSNTDPMPDQTGGYNDFSAHMVSTGLQIRF